MIDEDGQVLGREGLDERVEGDIGPDARRALRAREQLGQHGLPFPAGRGFEGLGAERQGLGLGLVGGHEAVGRAVDLRVELPGLFGRARVFLERRRHVGVQGLGVPAQLLGDVADDGEIVAARPAAGLAVGLERSLRFRRVAGVQMGPGRDELDRADGIGLEVLLLLLRDPLEGSRVPGQAEGLVPVLQDGGQDLRGVEGGEVGMIDELDGHGAGIEEAGRALALGHEGGLQGEDVLERAGQLDFSLQDAGVDGLQIAGLGIGGLDPLELLEPERRVPDLGRGDEFLVFGGGGLTALGRQLRRDDESQDERYGGGRPGERLDVHGSSSTKVHYSRFRQAPLSGYAKRPARTAPQEGQWEFAEDVRR